MTAVGILTTILFQVSLSFSKYSKRRQEKLSSANAIESSVKLANVKILSVLRSPELYKVAFLYTFSRLFLVICIIYIPIWLNEFMKTRTDQTIENIAIIPLIFFVASFVAAFLLQYINQKISHKVRESNGFRSINDADLSSIVDSPDHLLCRFFDLHIGMRLDNILLQLARGR